MPYKKKIIRKLKKLPTINLPQPHFSISQTLITLIDLSQKPRMASGKALNVIRKQLNRSIQLNPYIVIKDTTQRITNTTVKVLNKFGIDNPIDLEKLIQNANKIELILREHSDKNSKKPRN